MKTLRPLSVLLQPSKGENERLLKGCDDTKKFLYKIYPTNGEERLQIEMDRDPTFLKVPVHSFWSLMECFTPSFRLDVTLSYLSILVNTLVIWGAAIFFLMGSWELLREASIIKWEGLIEGGAKSYDYGVSGIGKLAIGFTCTTLHMFVAMITTFFSHWQRCPGVRIAWAEGTLLDLTRQFGYFIGYSFLTVGATMGLATIPHAGQVLENHPDVQMHLVDNEHTIDILKWQGHYSMRLDSELSVYLMLIGGFVCAVTVVAQVVLGEGFNVCYIFPFARCDHEWQKIAVECNMEDGGDDADKDKLVPKGLKFTTLCLTKERKNRCPWLATFAHNIFGAFRIHQYVATVFIAVGSLLRFYSTVPPEEGLKDWPIYIPWSNATHNPQPVYVMYTLHNTHNHTYNTTIDEWNDASYFMWTSSILYFTASILTLFSTFAYSIGLVTTRASMPANHVVEKSMFVQWCWS